MLRKWRGNAASGQQPLSDPRPTHAPSSTEVKPSKLRTRHRMSLLDKLGLVVVGWLVMTVLLVLLSALAGR